MYVCVCVETMYEAIYTNVLQEMLGLGQCVYVCVCVCVCVCVHVTYCY